MNERPTRGLLPCLLVLLFPLPAASSPARVSESSSDGLTIEYKAPAYSTHPVEIDGAAYTAVDAPGLPRTLRAGYPDLPFVSMPFAVPPGAEITVTVLAHDEMRVPIAPPPPVPAQSIEGEGDAAHPTQRLIPDPAFYASREIYPAQIAAAGARGRLRFQELAGVALQPFRYDAAARSLIVSTRILVRVSWGRPGTMPKGLEPAAGTDRYWEPVYRSVLPNYEDARPWRSKPAAPRASLRAGRRPPTLDGPQWKIPVRQSDLYRVDASSLTGLPAGTAAGSLRLYERIDVTNGPLPYEEGEVPIHVVDADADGQFGAGDYFVFYGLSNPDRFTDVDFDTLRYTDTHVYWLSLAGGGSSMQQVPGHHGYSGLTAPATFETWIHFEENETYEFVRTLLENGDPWEQRRVRSDHFFWSGPQGGAQYLRFEVRGVDIAAGSGLRVSVQDMRDEFRGCEVAIALDPSWREDVAGQPVTGSPFPISRIPGTAYLLGTEGLTLPPGYLAEGPNEVVGSPTMPQIYFNWVEVGYMRRYEAYQDRLDLTSGVASGPSEFRVGRFRTNALPLLFDVTDPRAPVRLTLDPSQLVRQGPQNFALTFQDGVASPRKYIALTEAALAAAPAPVLETAPAIPLSEPSRDADYLMICYDEFLPAVQPLADRRASQGHRVELVKASDVYDEFSGGSPSAVGIMRYLRWAMTRRGPESGGAPPAYVLLVGDASVDVNGWLTTSTPNFLPAPVYFSELSGTRGRELISTDPRYVLTLTSPPGEADWFEDLFLGRLPAGSVGQAEAMVQKILAYEDFRPEESWRGRVLLIADDQYHVFDSFGGNYCYSAAERLFRTDSESVIEDVHENARLNEIITTPFYAADYLDTVAVLGRNMGACPEYQQNLAYSRANVTPRLRSLLSEGHLLVMYQGHGNSSALADECLLVHSPVYGHADVDGVQNGGRPFVFYGFACHVNQFARETESYSGDCISEQLLLAGGRGAIASFAPCGYEWLSTVPLISRAVSKAFFLSPPKTELATGSTRWVLGPTMAAAKAYFVLDNTGPGQVDRTIAGSVENYCLLGEPALRMDALPPEYQVRVDGVTFEEGTRLRARAGRDSVLIRAEIRDELDVRPGSVALRVRGTPVAGTLFTLAPPADTTAANRPLVLSYKHRVAPDTYDIEISAADVSGRARAFRIPVVLEIALAAAGAPLDPNGPNLLPSSFSWSATIESPAVLRANDLGLLLDDRPIAASITNNTAAPEGLEWTLSAAVSGLADGSHSLAVRVDNGIDPAVRRSVPFTVNERLAVSDVFNFPNPFSEETRFYYTLSCDASSAEIRIYTVSGRLIRTITGTPKEGRNIVPGESAPGGWDGRDADGDAVANGLYFYRLIVASPDGRKTEVLGRLARLRGR